MRKGICAALLTILGTATPAAAVTLGVEWEMEQGVYNLDEGPADSGDTLFCSRETQNGYPLIAVTSDIDWDQVPNAATLEFVTAPIEHDDDAQWDAVLAFTQSFYTAVAAHCDAPHPQAATHCRATLTDILAAMNHGLGPGAELAVVDCRGIDAPRDPDRTGIVWAYAANGVDRTPLNFAVGSTQVNVPITLAQFGDDNNAFDVLYDVTTLANVGGPAGNLYMAFAAYRNAVLDLAQEGDLNDEQRGFLALYFVGANVHANARLRHPQQNNLDGNPANQPAWTFVDKEAWWIKNWFDLFPKVELDDLYATFSDDEKAEMAPFMAVAGNGHAANQANIALANRFCVVRDLGAGGQAGPAAATRNTCRLALKKWAAKLRADVDPLGVVYKPINIHRTRQCQPIDNRPVLFEMRGGAALNTTMTPVVGGGNVLAWPADARADGLPVVLQ